MRVNNLVFVSANQITNIAVVNQQTIRIRFRLQGKLQTHRFPNINLIYFLAVSVAMMLNISYQPHFTVRNRRLLFQLGRNQTQLF